MTMQIAIDLAQIQDKDSLHDALQHSLPLPPWYGRNLDALYDALTDGHEQWDIFFSHTDSARTALGNSYMQALRLTFDDAEASGAAVHADWH